MGTATCLDTSYDTCDLNLARCRRTVSRVLRAGLLSLIPQASWRFARRVGTARLASESPPTRDASLGYRASRGILRRIDATVQSVSDFVVLSDGGIGSDAMPPTAKVLIAAVDLFTPMAIRVGK